MHTDIHTPTRQAALRKLMTPAHNIRRASTIAAALTAMLMIYTVAAVHDNTSNQLDAANECRTTPKTPAPRCTHLASASSQK